MKKEGHESRFNLKRIMYTLKGKVTPYFTHDGLPGHYVKKGRQDNLSPTSTLGWTDSTLSARADIPGNVKLTVEQSATVFTSPDTGASIAYFPDGSFQYAASIDSPLSARERLRREQRNLDWWDRQPEIMENEYVTETGVVVAAPDGGSSTKGTPYRHFKLKVPVSEAEEREFDVYAYNQGIGLVDRRKLQANDLARVRASVQYHERRLPGGKTTLVPWLRLFDVQRIR